MATQVLVDEPVVANEAELDETSIMLSMARLQEMHIALRNLRDTIPRVMDTVLIDPRAPEQLHSQFAQAATGAASDIKSFAQTMEDARSRDVMEKARESRARNPDKIAGWLVTDHEDWLDVKRDNGSEDVDTEGRVSSTKIFTSALTIDELQTILETFKESNPSFEVSLEDTTKTVKVYVPRPAHIHFEVQPNINGEGDYSINCTEKTKLHTAILEAISTRPKPKELEAILAMLASYAHITSRPCAKCCRLLDPNANFPVARLKQRTKQNNGQQLDDWQAFHVACT